MRIGVREGSVRCVEIWEVEEGGCVVEGDIFFFFSLWSPGFLTSEFFFLEGLRRWVRVWCGVAGVEERLETVYFGSR